MDLGDRTRRWTGWVCLGVVALFLLMGYHFGNIRFAPLAAGFMILAALCFFDRGREQVRSDGVHPRPDPGVNRASG